MPNRANVRYPSQISQASDPRLHELSAIIGRTERRIKKFTTVKDNAWEEVQEIFDEFRADPALKFVAKDGHVLGRQRRQGPDQFNAELFLQRLQEQFPQDWERYWNRVTVRRVDSALLESARSEGLLPLAIVTECTTTPEPTYARVRPEWSHGDAEHAVIFGIEKEEEPPDVEEVIISRTEYEQFLELQRLTEGMQPPAPRRGPGRPRREAQP